jgi:hypothetical protein
MSPPGNGEAALGDAATSKLTGARDYSACPHSTTLIQQMPAGYFHHAAGAAPLDASLAGAQSQPQSRRRLNMARARGC